MVRVKVENTRLRHYLARLHRRTLCYSRVSRNAEAFSSIVTRLPKRAFYPPANLNHTLIQQRPPNSVVVTLPICSRFLRLALIGEYVARFVTAVPE